MVMTEPQQVSRDRMSTEQVTVAIVIPTKGRPNDLAETVRSIAAQTRAPHELIIVDQSPASCEDRVRQLTAGCSDLQLKYFWAPEVPGLVQAREKGVQAASSNVIFFIDDDVTLDPDCIHALIERYQELPNVAGICGVDIGGAEVPWWLVLARRAYMLGAFKDERSVMNKRYAQLGAPQSVRLFSGGWMSYRRWVFDKFQFEGKLWGHRWNSSIDFSYRVSARFPLVIDPKVRIWHRRPYGTHTPEEFVRIRVSGTFFFFSRNVKRNFWGWLSFGWVLCAIFIRSVWRGLQTKALPRTLRTFFEELRKGFAYLRHPFPGSY